MNILMKWAGKGNGKEKGKEDVKRVRMSRTRHAGARQI